MLKIQQKIPWKSLEWPFSIIINMKCFLLCILSQYGWNILYLYNMKKMSLNVITIIYKKNVLSENAFRCIMVERDYPIFSCARDLK